MGPLMVAGWDYPLAQHAMTDAERWTTVHGFHRETLYRNEDGDSLAESLNREPAATPGGTVYPRWTFPDGSAVGLGQCTWRIRFARLTREY
jgi:hypothetical protein